MIVKYYKNGRKIIGYIWFDYCYYWFKTGKPSDSECFGWMYQTLEEAEKTGNEYCENFLSYKNVLRKTR